MSFMDRYSVLNRYRTLFVCLLLIVATTAVFYQVKDHGFINLDDQPYITMNPQVQKGLTRESIAWAFTTTHGSDYWHPLTWLSHMLDYELFGLQPRGHHLVNLLFHILNTLLLFLILNRMTRAPWRSAFVAALFAIHPLHVESVAWAAERKDVLSTFFWMLTIGAYGLYAEKGNKVVYLCAVLFFALGLLAKPMLVTLPFVLMLLDYWPLGRLQWDPAKKKDLWKSASVLMMEKVPFLLLSLLASVVTVITIQRGATIVSYKELPLMSRIGEAFVFYCHYLEKTFWPKDLSILYFYAPGMYNLWQIFGALLVIAAITILTIKLRTRYRYLIIGWLWFLGILFPVMGVIKGGDLETMADRFSYVSLIGIFIMVSWGIHDATERLRYRRTILVLTAAAVLCLLMGASWIQVGYWRSNLVFFQHALSINPKSYILHNNLGATLAEQGRAAEAMRHYEEVLRLKPDDAEARYNMGNILLHQGHYREALTEYSEALRIKPDFAPAHNNAGIALSSLGKPEEAVPHFREALRISPELEGARKNLETALAKTERPRGTPVPIPGAQADPATAEGRLNAGLSFVAKGRVDEAIPYFREALKLNPNLAEAHISLGLALAYKQKFEEAASHFRKAVKLKPGVAEAHNSLGVALAQQGKIDEAIPEFQEALRINPRLAKAHNSLGVAMARKGKIDDAVRHLREAVRLKPDYEEAKRNLSVVSGMQGQR